MPSAALDHFVNSRYSNSTLSDQILHIHELIDHLSAEIQNSSMIHAHLSHDDYQFTVFMCTILVLTMQTGYAFYAAGFCRVKNVVGILFYKLIDMCLSCLGYFMFGYSLAFGSGRCNTVFGFSQFFGSNMHETDFMRWVYGYALIGKTVAIVSLTVLERGDFRGQAVLSFVLSAFILPAMQHWTWNLAPRGCCGWLYRLGFRDVCGSAVVHVAAGCCAFVYSGMVGARRIHGYRPGRRKPGITTGPLPSPHNIPMVYGGFVLLFMGFLGQSVGCCFAAGTATNVDLALVNQVYLVCLNTLVAFGFAGLTGAMLYRFFSPHETFDLPASLTAGLAGIVSIQASGSLIDPWAAALIAVPGALASYFMGMRVAERGMDDPTNTIGVNMAAGIWGAVAVWIFKRGDGLVFALEPLSTSGLGWAIFGTAMICVWCSLTTGTLLWLLRIFGWTRIDLDQERSGYDLMKHSSTAYPQFVIFYESEGSELISGRRRTSDFVASNASHNNPGFHAYQRPYSLTLPDYMADTPRPSPLVFPQKTQPRIAPQLQPPNGRLLSTPCSLPTPARNYVHSPHPYRRKSEICYRIKY